LPELISVAAFDEADLLGGASETQEELAYGPPFWPGLLSCGDTFRAVVGGQRLTQVAGRFCDLGHRTGVAGLEAGRPTSSPKCQFVF
jgi:hypothetical protein